MSKRRPKMQVLKGVQGELPLTRQLAILDDRNERDFERILTLIADVFEATNCAILVEEGGHYWNKVRGRKMMTSEGPSAGSFTRSTMAADDVFIVTDTTADPRFRNHPRVTGGPRIRFFFGAPLIALDGRRIGALAVMDDKPRAAPDAVQQRLLCHFAEHVMTEIQSRTYEYVGEQVRASEARLHRIEEHLARAQRLADVGSAAIDWVGDDHYWSDQMYRIFGLPIGSPIPSADALIRDVVHPDDREKVLEYHRRQKEGDFSQQCEYRIVRPDGDVRTIRRFGEIITDAAGQPVRAVMAIQDVTELRRVEKARDDYREQLHHAQRLDALGTLAGGIAHDLNNTLVPIIALTKLMRAEAANNDASRNLEVIQRAGERARDLVRQVLAFSRKTPIERHRIDLGEVVGEALDLMRASLDERIALEQRLMPDATVFADGGQIHQVVVNLVTNAAQAIGHRAGTIVVALKPGPGGALRLTVKDDGDGMDQRTLSRIFEPFFTTRSVGSGAGLGLSIVHGIVTGHGGSIAAESSPGHGTCITVDLPSHERRSAAALAIAAA